MPRIDSLHNALDGASKEEIASASQRCQDIAVLTLISVSVLNALECGGDDCLPGHILRFLPPDPRPVAACMSRYSSDAATSQLLSGLCLQYMDVTGALRACIARQVMSEPTSTSDLAAIIRGWRRFAGSVAQVIEAFARIEAVEQRAPIAWARLAGLLALTRDGGAPCSLRGEIVLPSDVDRRRFDRKRLQLEAVAARATGVARVLVTDISIGGLGLDFLNNPCPGEQVTVTLRSGRHLAGTVAWCCGARAGVRFHQRLNEHDPIFRIAARANDGASVARPPRPARLVQARTSMRELLPRADFPDQPLAALTAMGTDINTDVH